MKHASSAGEVRFSYSVYLRHPDFGSTHLLYYWTAEVSVVAERYRWCAGQPTRQEYGTSTHASTYLLTIYQHHGDDDEGQTTI